jgi:hypothetical protein
MAGYSQSELDGVQDRWQLQFPPDLLDILLDRRPLIDDPKCFDWITSDSKVIAESLAWPFEGFWFDVQNNDLWWPEWGEKPSKPSDQRERLAEVFLTVPKLIPLMGHRYLPDEPNEAGNPVFSVWQTDVIYYGADLFDWLERERQPGKRGRQQFKEIRFWSQVVRFNDERFSNGGSLRLDGATLGLPLLS